MLFVSSKNKTQHTNNAAAQNTIYKHAKIIAFVAGGASAVTSFLSERKNSTTQDTLLKASLRGAKTAFKEGTKYVVQTKLDQFFLSKNIVKHTTKHVSPMRLCANHAMNFCAQLAFNSASDIIKWRNKDITGEECLNRIKNNAGGIAGSMIVARGCMVLGGAIMPGIGAVALGVAGAYFGGYVGRKIAESF